MGHLAPNAYRAVILTAGVGARVGAFTQSLSKAMLPINHQPVISHIVTKFHPATPIVIALGHKGDALRAWLEADFPDRRFVFVAVDRYTGEGSGPGYSLLCCRSELQCPFVFYAVDTLVTGEVPAPTRNWFGVATVPDTARFCSVRFDGHRRITRIDDKTKNDNTDAFIGLAGVADYATFWHSLETDRGLIAGERQVSNGFRGLMESSAGLFAENFSWFDTGTAEEYGRTRRHFETHPEQWAR